VDGRSGQGTSQTLIRTIDAHAAGGPLRLVVDGFPSPRGASMTAKREWVERHADHLRRTLVLEPRGHAGMCGAILTEPVSPGAHAGVLFFHSDGYSAMSGHGILAVAKIASDRGLIMPGGDGTSLVFDTPAGIVRATLAGDRVSFVNVPAYVVHAGVPLQIGPRMLRADIACGGECYAIVDAESAGVSIDAAHVPELRRAAIAIRDGVEKVQAVDGTIFTGPPYEAGADLRNVAVFADGVVDRSPCGTGTSAVMAVVDAMGLLDAGRSFVHESVIGTRFDGRIIGRTMVGEYAAIVTEISGTAWITGEHTFVVHDRDPLKDGFRV
jgi:proline racemase